MATQAQFTPVCPLCRKPVVLETAKTDERGNAVHEDCYIRMLSLFSASQTPFEC